MQPSASLLKVWICWHLDLGCLVSRTLWNGYLLCAHPIQDSLLEQPVWLRHYFNKISTIVLPYPHLYFAHLLLPTLTCGLKRLTCKIPEANNPCVFSCILFWVVWWNSVSSCTISHLSTHKSPPFLPINRERHQNSHRFYYILLWMFYFIRSIFCWSLPMITIYQ